jgi:phosphatidylserine/phosphatidylglycerophosphate/cardiolipin synthase-like enzyme
VLTFWTRARRLLWSWWPWAIVCVWAIGDTRWGWGIGSGIMALVSYLIAPRAEPPRYGLDHEFAIEDPEFLTTVAGASGSPFLPGNTMELLNNGDAFYPPMLAAIEGAEASITIEAYIYWAGEIGRVFADALAEQARTSCHVKILLDAIGSASIGPEILDVLEAAGDETRVLVEHFGRDTLPQEHVARHGFPLDVFLRRHAEWWQRLLRSHREVASRA